MVAMRFNPELSGKIFQYWFRLQNSTTGWISRQQTIGAEPKLRCPEWAWWNPVNQMGPPVFYLTAARFLRVNPASAIYFLGSIYDNMVKTMQWYLDNLQLSRAPFTFVWNGRVADFSLDSGLDDFPRYYGVLPSEMVLYFRRLFSPRLLFEKNSSKTFLIYSILKKKKKRTSTSNPGWPRHLSQ